MALQLPLANWNGKLLPLDEATVSVLDRGFLFGDGVYEALRIYGGRAWLRHGHMRRLRSSLDELQIVCDVERLEQRIQETIQASGVSNGILYLQITRGVWKRQHHFPPANVPPSELIWIDSLPDDPYQKERRTGVAAITYPDLRWGRRDIKSINLLANCLAAEEARRRGCYEAVLVEPGGEISEGSHTSVFAIQGGVLLTAPNSPHILPGITRGLILDLAGRTGIPVMERPVRHCDLGSVDELFLTGTTTEVLSIVKLDDHQVGDGRPGPIAQRLQGAYRQAVTSWLSDGG